VHLSGSVRIILPVLIPDKGLGNLIKELEQRNQNAEKNASHKRCRIENTVIYAVYPPTNAQNEFHKRALLVLESLVNDVVLSALLLPSSFSFYTPPPLAHKASDQKIVPAAKVRITG
jgi:hypothetical protein